MPYAKDYVTQAIDYAKAAIRDKKRKRHGVLIRQAAARFLADLERAKTPDCHFYFSNDRADNVCDFIEKMPHVQGVWDSPTIVLHPAQLFFLVQLFGFRDKATGLRRFSSALFCIARKNAKSTLAAAIGIYVFLFEPEPGAQIRTAATTGQQARIVFDILKQMLDRQPDLLGRFGIESFARTITRPLTGSNIAAINAKASTQDGLNPSMVVLDEIHAHRDSDLMNVLRSAAGARRSPLWLYTTTEGYINAGPWADLRLFSKQILEGVFEFEADHFLCVIFAVDREDADFDATKYIKANPLMDSNPLLLKELKELAVEAKRMPSKLSEWRIKRLNRQSSVATGAINITDWKECGGEVDLDYLADFSCWGGVDLSSVDDMTAFRLVWLIDGTLYTHGWRWAPESAVAYRTERGTATYAPWVERGLIKETPGKRVDYAIVTEDIKQICKRFKVQKIGFDPFQAKGVISDLTDAGIECEEFTQTPAKFHPPWQQLEVAYGTGKLRHGGDPVLLWCASNLVMRQDAGERKAPDKRRSAEKIDDIVALLDAIGMIGQEEDYSFLTDPIIGR